MTAEHFHGTHGHLCVLDTRELPPLEPWAGQLSPSASAAALQ